MAEIFINFYKLLKNRLNNPELRKNICLLETTNNDLKIFKRMQTESLCKTLVRHYPVQTLSSTDIYCV